MKKNITGSNSANSYGNPCEFPGMENYVKVFNDDLEYDDFDDIYDYDDVKKYDINS